MDGRIYGWMDVGIDGWMDVGIAGWTDGRILVVKLLQIPINP